MVLINEKKFACATCIKGHRVSGCTHTDRPLFEVKKKGRPTTQCPHCRDKRKNGRNDGSKVHTKCACGDVPAPNVILPTDAVAAPSSTPATAETSHPPVSAAPTSVAPPAISEVETKKGQPGSKATFPNGLKDVHEMAAAAETLSEINTEEAIRNAELKVSSLLNPCKCMTGGPCKCCQPKRDRSDSLRPPSPSSSGTRTPTGTEGLIEMFKSKAITSSEGSCCSSSKPSSKRPSITTTSGTGPTWAQLMSPRDTFRSPENMHHPAHTSPHVHKAKLYSPYSLSGASTPKHSHRRDTLGSARGGWASSNTANRPPPPKLRPISDMNKFLGAVFKEDGSLAAEIPRSALGLPGIRTFDAMAENGGVKIEPMEVDMDLPISFPTHEDVVIGACTCGEDCDCAGCATHGIPPRTGSSDGHHHDHGCGENCKSSFDCADHLSLPSGITSIGHLLSLAAANVPPPAQKRPSDLSSHAHDTRILPPSAHLNEDAARSLGLVTLKPLECCNGRCQCPPGKCVCEKECCGCCVRCACDEDGDVRMDRESTARPSSTSRSSVTPVPASSCCSTDNAPPIVAPQPKSCCSTGVTTSRDPSPATSHTATPPAGSSSTLSNNTSPSSLVSPDQSQPFRQPSPRPPSTEQPQLRRATSTTQGKTPLTATARRATVTHGAAGVQRSSSTGKQVTKALALHQAPYHPHSGPNGHRPILPKPHSGSNLAVHKSASGSRVPSPGAHRNSRDGGTSSAQQSANQSQDTSPSMQAQQVQPPIQPFQLPDSFGQSQPNPDIDPSLDLTDEAFMAFINQYAADGTVYNDQTATSSEGSMEQALTTPDLNFGQSGPFENLSLGSAGLNSAGMGEDSAGVDPDFLTMLTDAINSAGQSGLQQPPNQPAPPPQMQHQRATPQSSASSQYIQPYPLDPAVYPPLPQPRSASPSSSGQLGIRTVAPGPSSMNTGFVTSLSDLVTSQQYQANQAIQSQRQDNPEPVYRQLPPQSTAFLQQVLGQNPAFAGGLLAPSGSDVNGFGGGGSNGNMIDLSKPLNSSDVERILRALQDQQAAQAAAGQPYQPASSAPPQRPMSRSTSQSIPPQASLPPQRQHVPTQHQPDFQQPMPSAGGYPDMAFGSQELLNRYMMENGPMMASDPSGMGMSMPLSGGNGTMGFPVGVMPEYSGGSGLDGVTNGPSGLGSGTWDGFWVQGGNPYVTQGLVENMKRGTGI